MGALGFDLRPGAQRDKRIPVVQTRIVSFQLGLFPPRLRAAGKGEENYGGWMVSHVRVMDSSPPPAPASA
jgi:hypothetical protein